MVMMWCASLSWPFLCTVSAVASAHESLTKCCMQDGTQEETGWSHGCVASFSPLIPCNRRGEAMDVLVYTRIFSYAALGYCATGGCPRMFEFLGIERT